MTMPDMKNFILNVTDVRYKGDHRLWLRFNDGIEGEVNLGEYLDGDVFEPLRDPNYFACLRLDLETRTVAWPNGADFAPEFLHALCEGKTTVFSQLNGGRNRSGGARKVSERSGSMRPIMKQYGIAHDDQGVAAYEIGDDFIRIQFVDGSVYVYDAVRPGRYHVEQMKILAEAGKGLTTYINRHVGKAYARVE